MLAEGVVGILPSPASTEQDFEASYAALLQQQAEQAVVKQRNQLRAHADKRISRGI